MLITTTNEVPGYEIQEILGEAFGLTVRSRHLGSQIGASFKSLVGGELAGFVAMMIFLAILVVGFVYEWKKGALDWE